MTDQTAPTAPEAAPAEAPAATAVPVTASVAAAPEVATETAARPEGLPDAYWDADNNAIKPEAYARLAELEAAEAARAADVPADATGYKLELPEAINGPDGKPVEFDAEDPLAKSFLETAVKHKLPQPVVSDILAAFASQEVALATEQAEFIKNEIGKLGAEHPKRVAAVRTAVAAAAGDKAEALLAVLGTAASFEALEALIAKANGPTVSAAPAPQPNADLAGLTGADRLHAIRARQAG